MALDFSNVQEAKESGMTPPGTIDIFKIKEVVFGNSKNKGTYGMTCTFSRKQDEFKHTFYLSEKALPRVKSLVKHASGVELGAKVEEEQIISYLKGKEIAMKVSGRVDENNGKSYADLSFGGFSKEAVRLGELVFSDEELSNIAKAKKAKEAGATAKPDAEESVGGAAAPTPTAEGPVDLKEEDF